MVWGPIEYKRRAPKECIKGAGPKSGRHSAAASFQPPQVLDEAADAKENTKRLGLMMHYITLKLQSNETSRMRHEQAMLQRLEAIEARLPPLPPQPPGPPQPPQPMPTPTPPPSGRAPGHRPVAERARSPSLDSEGLYSMLVNK